MVSCRLRRGTQEVCEGKAGRRGEPHLWCSAACYMHGSA